MRHTFSFLFLLALITISSCRKDFDTIPNFGDLRFSKDTVYLDTVFSNIGSSTYNLKVYNKSSNAITIPSIQLGNGNNSNYRLNVDGVPGKQFQNIDILANDSIYVFIEATVNISNQNNPLYIDKIVFDTGTNEQEVALVTLVQDAVFLYPGRNANTLEIDSLALGGKKFAQGRFLNDNELIFTNQKPYVVYGYIAVPENKTLQVDAGAKIHFHQNSGLIVDAKASLKINGTLNEQVILEGDRLEPNFNNIPGQWSAIWLRAGSVHNQINYATIKNGTIGVLVDSLGSPTLPTLEIKNSQIYNHSSFGILGRETHIKGENLVIGAAGQISMAATIGGTYRFTHCTFANFWTSSFRDNPAVLVNNFYSYTNTSNQEVFETRDLIAAEFINCIIDGNNNVELVFDNVTGSQFNYSIKNSMIRFNDINNNFTNVTELNFDDQNHYQNNILNGTPNFKNPFLNEFLIGIDNSGIGKAALNAAQTVPLDITGKDRTITPDMGAYQNDGAN